MWYRVFVCGALLCLVAFSCGNSKSNEGSVKRIDISSFEIENRVTQSTLVNKILETIDNKITLWIGDSTFIDAVKKANSENATRTIAEIKALDEKWIKSKGKDEEFKSIIENAASNKLKEIVAQGNGLYAEIFIMDFQGCNVALADLTSDLWQGDEEKFTLSYREGKGGVFIDKVKYDESTQKNLVQVSLPVIDASKVIGAITIGLDIDQL